MREEAKSGSEIQFCNESISRLRNALTWTAVGVAGMLIMNIAERNIHHTEIPSLSLGTNLLNICSLAVPVSISLNTAFVLTRDAIFERIQQRNLQRLEELEDFQRIRIELQKALLIATSLICITKVTSIAARIFHDRQIPIPVDINLLNLDILFSYVAPLLISGGLYILFRDLSRKFRRKELVEL